MVEKTSKKRLKDCFKMYADFIVVSHPTTCKIAQASRKDVLQVMFYVGSVVRVCFSFYVLEGSL